MYIWSWRENSAIRGFYANLLVWRDMCSLWSVSLTRRNRALDSFTVSLSPRLHAVAGLGLSMRWLDGTGSPIQKQMPHCREKRGLSWALTRLISLAFQTWHASPDRKFSFQQRRPTCPADNWRCTAVKLDVFAGGKVYGKFIIGPIPAPEC